VERESERTNEEEGEEEGLERYRAERMAMEEAESR